MEFSKFTPIETWHRMRLCNTFDQYSLILLVRVLNLVKWAQQKSNFPILMRFLFSLDCSYRMTYEVQCSTPVCLSFFLVSRWVLRSHSQAFPQELLNSWLLAGCSGFPLSSPAPWLASFTTGLSWLSALSIFCLGFTSALCSIMFFSPTAEWTADLFLKLPPSSVSPNWWLSIIIYFSSFSACPWTGSSQRAEWTYWDRDVLFSAGPTLKCGRSNICSESSWALKSLRRE